MMNRKLTALLAVLFMMAGLLTAGVTEQKKAPAKDKQKKSRVIILDGNDIRIDLGNLRRDLKNLTEVELDAVREELADLPQKLKQVEVELAELPARLKAVEKELASLPAVMKQVEKELAGLPDTLKAVEKELAQIRHLDIDKIVAEALKPLENLDKQVEEALKKHSSEKSPQ